MQISSSSVLRLSFKGKIILLIAFTNRFVGVPSNISYRPLSAINACGSTLSRRPSTNTGRISSSSNSFIGVIHLIARPPGGPPGFSSSLPFKSILQGISP